MSNYYIASLKNTHSHHEHVQFWGRMERGYTPVVGPNAGRYCFGEAVDLNDGLDCIAVPLQIVESLLAAEPYYKAGHRLYDQTGPVVDNTRANWKILVAGSLDRGRDVSRVTPAVFRGKRRTLTAQALALATTE
ncbi:hypothetical protein ACSFA0_22615 [Variovorax sp. LT1P1]|uniref:hypothetical protein n=1 Tax=Variovorax sp. LT1P1 TaxID=3443730 RepID=UPI003F48BF9C